MSTFLDFIDEATFIDNMQDAKSFKSRSIMHLQNQGYTSDQAQVMFESNVGYVYAECSKDQRESLPIFKL